MLVISDEFLDYLGLLGGIYAGLSYVLIDWVGFVFCDSLLICDDLVVCFC